MAVRRKSNWYIYFIAFGLALAFAGGIIFSFRWYLFPEIKESTGLTADGELDANFKPDESHNFTLLTMLSDGESDIPDLFMMVAFNAVENRLAFIPLPNGISVPADGRTLPNVYAAQGGEAAVYAVSDATGITCDGYVRLDRESFIRLVSAYGNVEYNVPKTLIVDDGAELDTFNAGMQIFSAESMFRYVYLADFGEDEQYRFNMIGDIISELVNQNLVYVDSALLDSYFGIITNGNDTNLTEELFSAKKAALLNTATYGSDPAEYYVPYGEYSGDGSFVISENSVITISQKCGIYE